jgi:hypothetical protein
MAFRPRFVLFLNDAHFKNGRSKWLCLTLSTAWRQEEGYQNKAQPYLYDVQSALLCKKTNGIKYFESIYVHEPDVNRISFVTGISSRYEVHWSEDPSHGVLVKETGAYPLSP